MLGTRIVVLSAGRGRGAGGRAAVAVALVLVRGRAGLGAGARSAVAGGRDVATWVRGDDPLVASATATATSTIAGAPARHRHGARAARARATGARHGSRLEQFQDPAGTRARNQSTRTGVRRLAPLVGSAACLSARPTRGNVHLDRPDHDRSGGRQALLQRRCSAGRRRTARSATASSTRWPNSTVAMSPAISPQPPQQREAGVRRVWNSYITVTSADEALERARELGRDGPRPAFDVLDAGRMGVVQDPQGAYFMVWEPRANIGAGLVNAPERCAGTSSPTPDPRGVGELLFPTVRVDAEPMEGVDRPICVIKRGDGQTQRRDPRRGLDRALRTGWCTSAPTTSRVHWPRWRNSAGPSWCGSRVSGSGASLPFSDPQDAVFALYSGESIE